ncbi:MAG TPA: hypothetical protein PKE29_09835 [Phycisphaerales bacterium]|nr:hypothetical protein [Phycisphaerales bacterium]
MAIESGSKPPRELRKVCNWIARGPLSALTAMLIVLWIYLLFGVVQWRVPGWFTCDILYGEAQVMTDPMPERYEAPSCR